MYSKIPLCFRETVPLKGFIGESQLLRRSWWKCQTYVHWRYVRSTNRKKKNIYFGPREAIMENRILAWNRNVHCPFSLWGVSKTKFGAKIFFAKKVSKLHALKVPTFLLYSLKNFVSRTYILYLFYINIVINMVMVK